MKTAIVALLLVAASARAEDAVAPLFKNPVQLGEPLAVVDTLVPWAYDAKGNAFTTVASKVRRYDPADPAPSRSATGRSSSTRTTSSRA